VDFIRLYFDRAALDDEHGAMERLDQARGIQTRTVAELLTLDVGGLPAKVDALVDVYLEGFGAAQTIAMRTELADEFLAAAPFTELSYRIWRRILRDDNYLPEERVRVPSDQLLPEVDLISADFGPRSAAADHRRAA
jgi:hypothetical protein